MRVAGRRVADLAWRVAGDAHERSRSEQPSRVGGCHAVEAEVHAVGACGEGDVDAPVYQDPDAATAALGCRSGLCAEGIDPGEEGVAVEGSVPHLEPVDSCRDGGRDGNERDAAVHHEGENGPPGGAGRSRGFGAQKLASPSVGLDAEA